MLIKKEVPQKETVESRQHIMLPDGVRASLVTNGRNEVTQVLFPPIVVHVPRGEFGFAYFPVENGSIQVEEFSHHPMNMRVRYGKDTDHNRIVENQDMLLLTIEQNGRKVGWTFPRTLRNGAVVAKVNLEQPSDAAETDAASFAVHLFEKHMNHLQPITPKTAREDGKIFHGTQILGHVKDACDMQLDAFEKGKLPHWQFAFPPTHRTTVNQQALKNVGVPTDRVTTNWVYGPESEELPSNFRSAASFPTLLAFLAGNSELCAQAARGDFSVISTNFKQEGIVLKMISPDATLTGINFSFLSGQPGERAQQHQDLPVFQTMLQRVQDSLDGASVTLTRIAGQSTEAINWWQLVGEKMQNVDVLFYRTFSFDQRLPKEVGKSLVVQIPHPIPEVSLTKEQARDHIGSIIGRSLQPNEKVVLLPGASEDGLFAQRTAEVFSIAQKRKDVVVLLPLSRDDARLEEVELPSNVFPIGFREDWMDILPGADTTIIRGSWGEILDVVAAGVVPVISSPGTVPTEGDPGFIQFLSEVSGERAVNVSLFIEELQKRGLSTEVIAGLLADIANANTPGRVTAAIDFALNDDVIANVREALGTIQKDGVHWMVQLHELLRSFQPQDFKEHIDLLHQTIWEDHAHS